MRCRQQTMTAVIECDPLAVGFAHHHDRTQSPQTGQAMQEMPMDDDTR
jgi:hypothetical protein